MPQTRESKPASAQPNIQDVFLNYARREKLPVHIRLMDGTDLEGRVKNFDRFAVIVEHQRRRSHDLQARHRDHPVAASDEQLLLFARKLIGHHPRQSASS